MVAKEFVRTGRLHEAAKIYLDLGHKKEAEELLQKLLEKKP